MTRKSAPALGLVAACLIGCASCGGGGGRTPSPAPVPVPPPANAFAEVDAAANAVFVAEGIPGMGLAIYDAQGVKRFEKMYGAFEADRRIAIASASKLVSGLTILRLVDQGFLSLDSTTGEVLGWTGPQADISLRQLLSFTSGLPAEVECTHLQLVTLAECVDEISTLTPVAEPGTRFDYANTHLHVAARMAEVMTGDDWAGVFDTQLKQPLGLGGDMLYYSAPRQAFGTSNPLIAGGLRTTMDEYARVLELLFSRGTYDGDRLIADALFTEQGSEPYPDAEIGNSPFTAVAMDFHYGFAAWLECTPPAADCPVISSPGAFGFTPWVDRESGYYAIIGMEVPNPELGVVNFSVSLAQELEPLIRAALRAN